MLSSTGLTATDYPIPSSVNGTERIAVHRSLHPIEANGANVVVRVEKADEKGRKGVQKNTIRRLTTMAGIFGQFSI